LYDDSKYVNSMKERFKGSEKPLELNDTQDKKLRDFNFLLGSLKDPVDINSLNDEYADFIRDLPEKKQEEVNESLILARSRGKAIVGNTYHFKNVEHARAFYQSMIKKIPASSDIKSMNEYMSRWEGKFKALDRSLAKKDEVDGMKPYEYIMKLYKEKIGQVNADK